MKKLATGLIALLLPALLFAQQHAANLQRLTRVRVAENELVLLNNATALLPLKNVQDYNIASVSFGYEQAAMFDSIANKYWKVTPFNANFLTSEADYNDLHDKLKLSSLVIFKISASTKVSNALISFLKDEESVAHTIIILQGEAGKLAQLRTLKSPVIWYKSNTAEGASQAAQAVFGGVGVGGKLNTSVAGLKSGTGYVTKKIRLGYTVPEAVAVNSENLNKIDSIAAAGIATHSSPGMVILLAKDGQVIFSKAYGKHTYDGPDATKLDDIFDMASITKVTATTPTVMQLYDKHIISLDSPISKYVARLRTIPDKSDVKIREALLHEAGFTPYIKFFEKLKSGDMSTDSSAAYPTKVADHYYLRANYFNEVMWPVTLASKGDNTRGKFVYSDVSMYMMKEVVEEVTHQKLNDYVLNHFYLPLGMQSTGYLPRNRFDRSRIVPTTENDNWFRNMLVQGYVNDPGAAMAGGVEGHAGLFANANDLAIYYQMLLNKGTYGGRKYFSDTTVTYFTSRQSKTSWRGLGFDRVNTRTVNDHRSDLAFGHSGYTGTYVWVDPKYNMVYICLTNRVYPDDGKTYGPAKVNIRQQALDAFYDAVVKGTK